MSKTHPAARLAVDIGGTFTDIVLLAGDRRLVAKVLTTPKAPEAAVVDGTRAVLSAAGLGFADIGVLVHGTTLATNAIIERKGAATALIATDGFRDVIEIADESRFDQYDINIVKTQPLVPRELRFTVPERMDVHGAVRLPLDEGAVRRVAERLQVARHRRGGRRPDPRLRQSRARAAHRRNPGRDVPEAERDAVVAGLPRGARVRAHLHGHRQRLRAAADVGLSAAAGAGFCRAWLPRTDPPDDLRRQPRQPRHGGTLSRAPHRIRGPPAAPSWQAASRSSAEKGASSPSTWAAPQPRSA